MREIARRAGRIESTGLPDSAAETAKIMLVDDDPRTIDLVQFQLEEMGYRNFVACTDAADALRLLARENPDVLLLDLVMPKVSGLEILARVRYSYEPGHLPVIILTVVDDAHTKIKALELGATDFLNKPVNFFELGPRVRNALMVKAYHDQLKRHADELESQVLLKTASLRESHAALERTNLVLRRSCEAAEAATRAKSEFLANVSHELRTPLTAIIGFTEELLCETGRAAPSAEFSELLEVVLRNGEHLLQIVSDILDVARIEKGRLPVERVTCAPGAILADVVRLLKPMAQTQGLELVAEAAGIVPETISSDPTRLRQILTNLLNNAIKFTERGSVRVVWQLLDAEGSTPKLQFEVVDTGVGIAPEEVAEIFKPFARARAANGDKFGGTGLGLAISKYLTEELGGQIQVKSRPGVGSTFRFTVDTGPLPAFPGRARQDAVLPQQTVPSQTGRDPTLDGPLSIRVLLAEDSLDTQRLIRRLLERAGAEVTSVADGRAAFREATEAGRRGKPFDLLLTDIQMPVVDGHQLAMRLRGDGYRGPIIALTANAMAGEREKCLASGCNDYLTKPIDRDRLLSMMARYSSDRLVLGPSRGT